MISKRFHLLAVVLEDFFIKGHSLDSAHGIFQADFTYITLRGINPVHCLTAYFRKHLQDDLRVSLLKDRQRVPVFVCKKSGSNIRFPAISEFVRNSGQSIPKLQKGSRCLGVYCVGACKCRVPACRCACAGKNVRNIRGFCSGSCKRNKVVGHGRIDRTQGSVHTLFKKPYHGGRRIITGNPAVDVCGNRFVYRIADSADGILSYFRVTDCHKRRPWRVENPLSCFISVR